MTAAIGSACSSSSTNTPLPNSTIASIREFKAGYAPSGQLRPGSLPVAQWDGQDTVDPVTTTSTTTTTTTVPKPSPPPPIVPSDVLFDTDRADLKPGAPAVLKQLADQIAAEAPTARLEFIGYTDSRGTEQHNAALSLRRAQAVMVWFAGYGFDTARLSARGEGEGHPLAADTDGQGRFIENAGRQNRRVEIRIIQ